MRRKVCCPGLDQKTVSVSRRTLFLLLYEYMYHAVQCMDAGKYE